MNVETNLRVMILEHRITSLSSKVQKQFSVQSCFISSLRIFVLSQFNFHCGMKQDFDTFNEISDIVNSINSLFHSRGEQQQHIHLYMEIFRTWNKSKQKFCSQTLTNFSSRLFVPSTVHVRNSALRTTAKSLTNSEIMKFKFTKHFVNENLIISTSNNNSMWNFFGRMK